MGRSLSVQRRSATTARRIAYATQSAGSDWETWHVRSVATALDTNDAIERSKFSGASWLKDGSGLYYSRYAAPTTDATYKNALYGQQVHFHKIGTPQSVDRLVYRIPHIKITFSARM